MKAIGYAMNAPQLEDVLSFFASLRAPENCWNELIGALGHDEKEIREVSESIVRAACPVEATDGHPWRASYEVTPAGVVFTTPGNVKISLCSHPDDGSKLALFIDFGRDSSYAAAMVAARIAVATKEAGALTDWALTVSEEQIARFQRSGSYEDLTATFATADIECH